MFRWFKRPVLTVAEPTDEGAAERETEGTERKIPRTGDGGNR